MVNPGFVLRRWREQRGMTQEEVAKQAGIRQSSLSKLENGLTENPGFIYLARIVAVFGRSLDELAAECSDREEAALLLPAACAA